MATDMTIAKTILEQIGGGRFMAMCGAKHLTGHGEDEASLGALSFKLPGSGGFTKGGINHVKITLTPSDTYTIVFNKIRGMKVTEVAKVEEVYCDTLQSVFTETTGLFTHL